MSAILFDQLERLKTARGKELLATDRLEGGRVIIVASPPTPSDGRIKFEVAEEVEPRVTVRQPKAP